MRMYSNIFDSLYKLDIPKKVWRYSNTDLLSDFSQYCYLQLLELPQSKLEALLDSGNLSNYFFILCKRQAAPGSHFWNEHQGRINFDYDTNNYTERSIEEDS
jgi:hypothetical protein